MSDNRWVYEKGSGKWMSVFRDPRVYATDPVNYGLADLGDLAPSPDPILDRYDAVNARNRRATTTEVDESRADLVHARGLGRLDGAEKDVIATVICGLWGRLNRQPTAPEIAAERARWLQIYERL